jgi:hypothetical protein
VTPTKRTIDRATFFQKIGYAPHKEQLLFHNSKARFRIPVCGRRFGKSKMAGSDLEPHLFLPKKMDWVVGPTYDLGEKEFRVIWDDLIIGMEMGKDKRIKRAYNKKQGNMYLEFPWQTRLEVRSADHPENLVGEALDRVIVSEAAKHKIETWERFLRPALADKRGSADFPTTPEGFNWLHALWQLGRNPNFPDFESWQFPSWANPILYPGGRQDPEILLQEQTTTPEWFAQEIGADFASFVGKIFPEWDELTHVRDVRYNPDLPNYIAFDWGYTNPLAAIEFQIGPNDTIYIWREHYLSFTMLDDHIRILKDREHPADYKIDLAFGDAADPEAARQVSEKFVQCLALPAAKSDFTWREGIDLMRTFMKSIPVSTDAYNPDSGILVVDEYGTPAPDEPRFIVDHSCVNTIREINNYRSKMPVKGQNVPEWGVKMEDHTIDAMRYALIHIYKLGATTSLADIYHGQSWRPDHDPAGALTTGGLEPLTLDQGELGAGFGNMERMEF